MHHWAVVREGREGMSEATHLTYPDAAMWLTKRGVDVKAKTLQRWGRVGKVRVLDLGKSLKRIAVSDLEKLLKENTR